LSPYLVITCADARKLRDDNNMATITKNVFFMMIGFNTI